MKKRYAAIVLGLLVVLSLSMQAFAIAPADVATTDIRKLVDVKSIRGAKGSKRVAVPGYRVIFTTRTKVVARAEDWLGGVGGGSSSGAKATMEVVLGNVEFETLQAIADAAYADFMDDLKSSGIEVVPMETIAASASFQKMKMTGSTAEKPYTKRSRDKKTDYIVVSPSAIPLWFTNWDGDVSDQGMNQTNIRAIMSMSKELDALMLYPIMHVDFATVGGSGGKFARRASVSAKAAIYANPAYTLFFIANDKGGAFARMTDGIGVEGDPGEFVTADHASNTTFIGSMQKIGIDFGPVKSKKNMVLQTNREQFHDLALEALSGTNTAFRRAIQEAQK
ncbi:MAG TPA: hypothetical protein VGQ76_10700 [Thermoanaerobaculia bacterium]|jgi:hypothetical protein|nr:hypothetical protein [Thermoanaerobaculia bacterium]